MNEKNEKELNETIDKMDPLGQRAWRIMRPAIDFAAQLKDAKDPQDAYTQIRAKLDEAVKRSDLTTDETRELFITSTTHRVMEEIEARHVKRMALAAFKELVEGGGDKDEDRKPVGFGAWMKQQKPENN